MLFRSTATTEIYTSVHTFPYTTLFRSTALAAGPRAVPALPPPIKLKGGPLTTAEIEAWIAKSHD